MPGALWLPAEQTGLLGVLETFWPAPRSGPSPARYLLLAAIHLNLRQVGLSHVLDGANGLSFMPSRVSRQCVAWEEFPTSVARMLAMLDRCQPRATRSRWCWTKVPRLRPTGWNCKRRGGLDLGPLPWNQAPASFRERAVEQLPSSAQPGVRAAAEKLWVHGQEYLCVLKYSASFAGEPRPSTSLSKVLQSLRGSPWN